jgi:nitrite reductase/ring-hydroxylating ferredoxin subunit
LILCEQVNGGEHPWAAVYDPGRSMVHGLREYLSETLGAARHWAAHLGRGDVESADQLPPGQGAIVRDGAHKLAAYRTPTGELRFLSATCTHAGCIVRWNGFENCWDCPCHGSQFSIDGEPLQGPATRPLAPAAATREHSRPRAGAESSSRPTAAEAQREAENLSPRPRANEPGTSADRG